MDASRYYFPTASKTRLLCKSDLTTHRGPADAFQGDPAAELSNSSLSQQQQELLGVEKNPILHKVKLGCHERQLHKGFFMSSSSPAQE